MIRTKVIETRLMPRGRYIAITLFGLVFTWRRDLVDARVLNHELIHCQQQLEWLYIPFFVLYVAEWLWHFAKCRDWNTAYRRISFEREAYDHESDPDYLRRRRPCANYRRPTS